jgi:hypothetical protein
MAIDQIDGASGVIGLTVHLDSPPQLPVTNAPRTTTSCGETQQLAVGRQFDLACRKAARPESHSRRSD